MNQALDEYIIELNKKTNRTHIDDNSIKTLAHLIFQIENLHKPNSIPLGLLCGDLALRRQISNIGQAACATRHLSGRATIVDRIAQNPVKNQIGIAPNGRREMRISIASQPEMTDIFGCVHRFLH